MLIKSVVPLQPSPQTYKFTIPYTAVNGVISMMNSGTIFTLPIKGRIVDVFAIVTSGFAGSGILTMSMSCGIAGNANKYLTAGSVLTANTVFQPAAATAGGLESATATTAIEWFAQSTGATLNNLSAGSMDFYITVIQAV